MEKCIICGNEVLPIEEKRLSKYVYHNFCHKIVEEETIKNFPNVKRINMKEIIKKCKEKYLEVRGTKNV